VAKMLKIRRCIECWRVCDFRVGDQYPFPTDCPLPEAEPAPLAELANLCNMPNDETLLPAVVEHVKETKRVAAEVQNWLQCQPENSGEFAGGNIFIVACTIADRRKAEPAPYSAENPPKEGDMVRTRDGNSGMICSIRIVQEMGGTKIAFVRVVFPVLPARSSPVFDCYAITEVSLLYRPPSGDQP